MVGDVKNEDGLSSNKVTCLRPTKPCVICKKPSKQKFHPFCSARCANIDLNRWLSGVYIIPADEEDLNDELVEKDQY